MGGSVRCLRDWQFYYFVGEACRWVALEIF
jgi:hypothetical protein